MPNVLEVAAQFPELTLTQSLLEQVGLGDIFSCAGPFTAFLPTNTAWDNLDPMFLAFILRPENQDQLEEILLYHIVGGSFPSDELQTGNLETLQGEDVTVGLSPISVNGAGVETADISACNGIIHLIDAVLRFDDRRKCFGILLCH